MAFYALERLSNLYDGYRRPFVVTGKPLLLLQDNGRRFIIVNQCPHLKAPLEKGTIREGLIQCPVHGMRFDLYTGESPDACADKLQLLAVSYDGNQIGVSL